MSWRLRWCALYAFHLLPRIPMEAMRPLLPLGTIIRILLRFHPMQHAVFAYPVWKAYAIKVVDLMLENTSGKTGIGFCKRVPLSIVCGDGDTLGSRHNAGDVGIL